MWRTAAIVLLGLVGVAAALALLRSPAAAAAPTCSVRWANPAGGAWTHAASWSTGVVPGQLDDVCIDGAGTYQVTLTGSGSVRSLTVGGATGGQTLTLLATPDAQARLELAAPSTIQSTGTFELHGGQMGALVIGDAPVVNHGTLGFRRGGGWQRMFVGSLSNASDGRVEVEADHVDLSSGAIVNDGSITVDAGSALTVVGGSFASNHGSTLTLDGPFLGYAMTFTQAGGTVSGAEVALTAGSTLDDRAGPGTFSLRERNTLVGTIPAGQTVTVEGVDGGGASLELPGPVTNNGTLRLGPGGRAATVHGAGHLTNNATIRTLDGSLGFRILGMDLTNAPGATIEIGGPSTVIGTQGTTTTNDGTIVVAAAGQLYIDHSTFRSRPGSVLDLGHGGGAMAMGATFVQSGGTIVGSPVILRESILEDSGGPGAFLLEAGDVPNLVRGTIPAGQLVTVAQTISGQATANFDGPSVVNNGHLILTSQPGQGRMTLVGGSPLVNNGMLAMPVGAGGARIIRFPLTNNGLVATDTDVLVDMGTSVVNNARVALEDGGSLLLVGGSFTNAAGGTMAVTVDATEPRPPSPGVTVLGGPATVFLGGTLEVATIGTPAVGTAYTPISVDNRTGTFSRLTFGSVPYEATYSPTSVGLVVSPPRARFVPVTPDRILDTRTGNGTAAGRLPAGGTVSLTVAGRGGVPVNGASAVAVTVTGVDSSPGFVTVWPGGTPKPGTSNLNTSWPGQTVAVQVVVPVGSDGTVSLSTSGGGHLLADVAGWYETATTATSGRFAAVTPSRLLDTRNGTGAPAGRRGAGATVTLPVGGRSNVPVSGASAVVLSVTGVDSSPGFVTAWPSGQTRPNASNLNTDFRGQTMAAHVIVPLGAGGSVDLYTSGGGHLVVDVVGWFTDAAAPSSTSGLYVALTPQRRLDSRIGLGVAAGRRPAGSTTGIQLGGSGGIPSTGAVAVVANVTAVQADPTYLTAWAGGTQRPLASNLNVTLPGGTVPNLVTSPVGPTASPNLYTEAATHLLVDTFGFYLA